MAVQVELWKRGIETAFFDENNFLQYSTDVSSEVLNGAVVHIPQSGGPSGVVRNRSTFPAVSVRRADTDVVYLLDDFTSNPRTVTKMEQDQISYEKMNSAIKEDGANMLELSGSAILEFWVKNLGTDNRILSSGALKPVAGLVGNRKKLVAKDLRDAALLFDNMKVSSKDRVAMLTADQYNDLFDDADIKNTFSFTAANYATLTLPEYAGWKIVKRQYVVKLDSAGTVKLPEAALATNDDFAGIFLQKQCVEHALGERNVFMHIDDPLNYGSIMSMMLRTGGRARRADKKGVALLLQGK